jgi:hypothetical protein
MGEGVEFDSTAGILSEAKNLNDQLLNVEILRVAQNDTVIVVLEKTYHS